MDDELVAIVKALRERFPDDPFLKHDFSMKECIMENYEEQVRQADRNLPYTQREKHI